VSGELDGFDKFAGVMSEHWPWISGITIGAVYTVKRVYQFFRGVNRLADEMAEMKEAQKAMMTADMVDARVAPVNQALTYANERIAAIDAKQDRILDHLINRPKNQGSEDADPQD